MAEQERQTNKERRARAREERRRKEAEAARRHKRNQLRNGVITFVVIGVIGAVLLQAFLGGPENIEATILVSSSEAEEAQEAAGCEVLVEREPLEDRSHFEPDAIPEADSVYSGIRPTHSGPHGEIPYPVTPDADSQIDEVVSTHNLEHGAIIAWYDPDEVDGDAIGAWAERLNANGFEGQPGTGVGILSAPDEDAVIDSGKNVAFRAWGTAMDCDPFDETVANAFVIENYGTRGVGPERLGAPYPEEVLGYEDAEVSDTSAEEAPTDSRMDDTEE